MIKKYFSLLLCCWAVAVCGEITVKSGDAIAFLGDSITARGVNRSGGYINLTMAALRINGIDARMISAGFGGNKSPDMHARLKRDVLNKKPQIMTLSCGVNDVWHSVNGRGVSLEDYKKYITSMVKQAQAQGIKVYLLTSTMIFEDPDGKLNKQLVPYNDFLRELAEKENCVFVDMNGAMWRALAEVRRQYPDIAGELLTVDGVHMNPLGDKVMATELLKAFGLSEKEIAKAYETWQTLGYDHEKIRIRNCHMPAILKLANERKCSIYEIINNTLDEVFRVKR